MGMIKTHHSKYFVGNGLSTALTGGANTGHIITAVISGILRDSPGIVADVASGRLRNEVLEKVIIREMDRQSVIYEDTDRDIAVKRTFDYMFGYGPLQMFVENDDVSDIDGTKFNEFSVKIAGKRLKAEIDFGSEQEFDTFCKLIAVRNNGIINENDSHCRVTDEKNRLRINISIKPRNISGPSISIRKHRKVSYGLSELTELGMINDEICGLLLKIAGGNINTVLCGKGASGKTTLLRAIINLMPEMERVLICESDTELYPDKKYCIQQRIKKSNEGGTPVTLADLVRDGLTMSLDTYVIGEMVGGEALTFIRAVHSGHRGMATTHSLNSREAMTRILTLARSGSENESEENIKFMIASSIDVIIYMSNFRVAEICEVCGYDIDNGKFQFNPLIIYDKGFRRLNLPVGKLGEEVI